MTAHAQAGFREKCLEAGMNDYVPKPIALTVLAEALQAWLPGGERRRPVLRETPAAEGAPQAVWDRQAFMGRILDDEDLARDIVGGFRADAARRLDIMRRALSQGDFDLLASQAHSIKGASANLGAGRLREAAMTLETVAGTGRVGACRDGLDALSDALDRLVEEFRRTMPEGGRQAGGA
ncbi:Hpt domain protein [anaerobic digester metagenome]